MRVAGGYMLGSCVSASKQIMIGFWGKAAMQSYDRGVQLRTQMGILLDVSGVWAPWLLSLKLTTGMQFCFRSFQYS